MAEHSNNRANPKEVLKLADQGKMPSQIAVILNVSLHEVMEVFREQRKLDASKSKDTI